MKTTTYNGWSNRETWVVNLWLTNDERSYNEVRGLTATAIEAYVDDMYRDEELSQQMDGILVDLINSALAHVNWDEIADSVNAE